jgi:hypothetical protein
LVTLLRLTREHLRCKGNAAAAVQPFTLALLASVPLDKSEAVVQDKDLLGGVVSTAVFAR